MAVSSNDMYLAQEIEETGNKLAEFPTEVEVLLPILDVRTPLRVFIFGFFISKT